METWLIPIVVAVITGPLAMLVQRLRKENTEQHGESRVLLERVADRIEKVDDKLTSHIDWHLKQPKPRRKNNGSKKETA